MATVSARTSQLLFVGGLSADTFSEQIRDYVSTFTEVLSVKIAQDRKLKQSKGYALVKIPADADISTLLETRHNINGRRVDIQPAAKRSEKQQCQDEVKKRKLFVQNIPLTVTNEVFEGEIAKHPEIKSGYIIRDYHSGESKGYGYLQLVSDEAANQLQKRGLAIEGVSVRLVQYKYKYEPKSANEASSSPSNPSTKHQREKGTTYLFPKASRGAAKLPHKVNFKRRLRESASSQMSSHGNSSPNSEPERTSQQFRTEVRLKKMEYLTPRDFMDQSVENYRFNMSLVNRK